MAAAAAALLLLLLLLAVGCWLLLLLYIPEVSPCRGYPQVELPVPELHSSANETYECMHHEAISKQTIPFN